MILTRLKGLRLAVPLSQAELAARAGLRRATITRLEAGTQEARPATVRKLCAALGVATVALAGGRLADDDGAERVDGAGTVLPARQGGWGPVEVGQ